MTGFRVSHSSAPNCRLTGFETAVGHAGVFCGMSGLECSSFMTAEPCLKTRRGIDPFEVGPGLRCSDDQGSSG